MRKKKDGSEGLVVRNAYVMQDGSHPADRVTGWLFPLCDGISLDLQLQVDAARRFGFRVLRELGEFERWEPNDDLELHSPPTIYEVPINVMVNASKLRVIYGARYDARLRRAVWGPQCTAVTDAERTEVLERVKYRKNHRDEVDPLKAVVTTALASRPKKMKPAPNVYVAARYGLVRRRFGVFTDYRRALSMADRDATIFEISADGCTPTRKAKVLRGWINSGWGYASGYAPSDYEEVTARN